MQLCFTAIDGEDKTHIHYLFIHGQFGFGVLDQAGSIFAVMYVAKFLHFVGTAAIILPFVFIVPFFY